MFAILAAIVVLAILPVAAALGAYAVADAHGCRLNEAGVNPCVVLGIDMGGTLTFLGLLAWIAAAAVIYIRRRSHGRTA